MGRPVDRIDVTLAAVGLGATALATVTGGSSYTIKIGATVLKAARKMGKRLSSLFVLAVGLIVALAGSLASLAVAGCQWAMLRNAQKGKNVQT